MKIGLTQKESERFSISRMIMALAERMPTKAAFELDCCTAANQEARKQGRAARGHFFPDEILTRDITKGGTGGYLVGDGVVETRPESFAGVLRSRQMIRRLGATVLDDLSFDVSLPKQTQASAPVWVSEGNSISASDPEFGNVSLVPKTIGGATRFSRRLLRQSSVRLENWVSSELALSLAQAIDLAAINGLGSGSNQPLGILNTTGIGAVAIGTNGGAPTYAKILELESSLSDNNADIGSLAYLTNGKVRTKLKGTFTVDGGEISLWRGMGQDGIAELNGYRAAASNQVPSNLTKGSGENLSAIIFGNWADYIIGEWGGIDILVNPYGPGNVSGSVQVVVFQDVDGAVRRAESFAAIVDAAST